jgi:ABC-2 type transport system ATP-binding protein
MSISIRNLTKIYGEQKALNNVSFDIREGEIVGFLGPNGAGKSTTMKIATCFLPPTEGVVEVGGYNVLDYPREAKSVTGYLPEHNPLYLDLYVHEFLEFVAGLYGIKGPKATARVREMVELCGLGREQNKKIEALSKGYRQRVGLAQALIHDPKVLILDEPTSGLDPNQLLEIRRLIKDISRNKTVIFSTHIMQEVQALCDRVIVINRGEIVADDLLDNIFRNRQGGNAVVAEFDGDVNADLLATINGVGAVQKLGLKTFRLIAREGVVDVRAEIFRFAADHRLSLVGLKQEENSLESIFHQLTVVGKENE